jgi:hypothetical protein
MDELVRQVAESDAFRPAPMMRTLLLYLWKNQSQPVSEYAIAVDALGRPPDFDPKSDSTVRVQVARLRNKLKEFYETAGDFPLRLSIPLGKHEIQWVHQPKPAEAPSPLKGIPRPYLLAAAGTAASLIGICLFLLFEIHSLKASLPLAESSLPRFWQAFLRGGQPATIVIPNPLYFFWPEQKTYVRDLRISEFPNWPNSPLLQELSKKWGPPVAAQSYIGAVETGSGIKLLQYLEKAGMKVQMVESRRFAADSFGVQNTILMGMPRTATYLDGPMQRTNFYMAAVEPDVVGNRNPRQGELSEFREISYSADRRLVPAVMVFPPVRPEHTRSVILMGRTLTGMVTMLLSSEGLRQLDDQWIKGGSPDAWEMVVEAEINRDTVLKVWPVAFRSLPADFWK